MVTPSAHPGRLEIAEGVTGGGAQSGRRTYRARLQRTRRVGVALLSPGAAAWASREMRTDNNGS